jgi:acyl-CoA thioesterase-1
MRRRAKQWRSIHLILGITTSLFWAESGLAGDPPAMIHILVLGDSLSEGLFLNPEQAWPALLPPKLRQAGLKATILNASRSGDTSAGGLERIGRRLDSKIDIFILELGINDAIRGLPIAEIKRNLQEIIDRVKRAKPRVRVVICGMQLPDAAADDYVFAFGQMYVDLAAKNKAALVPYLLQGVGGNPALNEPDGLHPNAAGQRVLAENVWGVLEPIAREVARSGNSTTD